MKKLIISSILGFSLLFSNSTVYAAAEVKQACVKDSKTGKDVCKKIKVHKKLDGNKVPDKKK